jgi:hypothetical protein
LHAVESIPALVVTIHLALAIAAGALATIVGLAGAYAGFVGPVRRRRVDLLIGLEVLAVGLALVLGFLLFVTRGLPDLLHALYAVVALIALPGARIIGAPEQWTESTEVVLEIDQTLGRWLALASLITIGLLLRLAATG